MIDDPYKVLGVDRTAGQDEIKSAYRKMAKKYHPDLHPDDPQASVKMNEINEAYDMLTHPEKYERRRARQAYGNPYGGTYGAGSSQSGSYGNRNSGANGGYNYGGAGGWSSDFYGFDFEDLFNFANFYNSANSGFNSNDGIKPEVHVGDREEVRQAIEYINAGRYDEALMALMKTNHAGRDARWYYINALALYGKGETSQAADNMTRAVYLEPNNQTYKSLLNRFRSEGRTYYRTTVVSPFRAIGRFILLIFIIRIIFTFLSLLLGSGYYFPM